jgi:hypothetical protein
MASIIKAGNATDGVQVSSDATGALDIKTGTGAGTTAISIDASQAVTMPGNLVVTGTITAGAGTVYNLEQYTSPATWTKPADLKAIKVTVIGAGGSSGSSPSSNAGVGGGGGGGAAIEFIPAPSITSPTPGPVTVSVTAGPGTNSFGAFCSATAGGNSVSPALTAGGTGGVGSGGSINITGADGATGTNGSAGGSGGSSILGGGGRGGTAPNGVGVVGGNYGGGGGGDGGAPVVGPKTARAGAPGIVIVEEFY